MKRQCWVILALVVGSIPPAVQAQPAKEPLKPEAKSLTVPMEMLPSRHFLVKVKIDGQGPYSLILDTGAPLTIVTSKLAKATGLVKKGGGGGFGLFGGVNQLVIGKLEVGEVVAEKTPAVVMDHPTVDAISQAFQKDFGPIDGIVGFPFFARFAMTVDYQKKELTFKPNGYKPGDYMADMMKTLTSASERKDPRPVWAEGLWGVIVEKDKADEAAGMPVKKVYDESAAAKGGLQVGDRILTVDGRWTDSLVDLYTATSLVKPGRAVAVTVLRKGKEEKLSVKPAAGR
jgi:hypothetical protein